MNVEYFISKRIINAKENKNVFSRPIIRVTIFAVALSVAVMLIALSILNGFQNQIIDKVVSFASHIQIFKDKLDNKESSIILNDYFLDSLQVDGVSSVSPVVYEFGLIKTDSDFLGIQLKGVSYDYNWLCIEDKITDGKICHSDSTIIISELIAVKLNIKIGDKIRIYFPSIKNDRVNVRPFYVTAFYNSYMPDFDNNLTFVDISKLQTLKSWKNNKVSLIELSVDNFEDIDNVTQNVDLSVWNFFDTYHSRIETLLSKDKISELSNKQKSTLDSFLRLNNDEKDVHLIQVKNIKQLYPQIFDWLKLQDMNVMVIILLMLLVAIMNIISSLLILILEKTSFIGVLKSFGSSNWTIRKIFMYNSLYLLARGLFWGNLIAFVLLFIQNQFEIISLDENTYYMSTIPISFDFGTIILLNLSTILVTFLMMILPTIVITKISPIRAIRFH